MRRKKGELLPIEIAVLESGLILRARGVQAFHGFLIAKEIKNQEDARLLTAHGTLYKALGRMAKAGWLESTWEDPLISAEQNRPRRRFYEVTVSGEAALEKARDSALQTVNAEGGLATA